jgi:hypothetical protein
MAQQNPADNFLNKMQYNILRLLEKNSEYVFSPENGAYLVMALSETAPQDLSNEWSLHLVPTW